MSSYLPGLVLVLAALVFLPFFRPEDARVRAVLLTLIAAATIRYFYWRIFVTLPPFRVGVWEVALYAFCVYEIVLGVLYLLDLRVVRRKQQRSREADQHLGWYGTRFPRIAVLIPTFNEGRDVLFRTIVGAKNLRYPNFDVWVLDDNKRGWLRELCDELSVHYVSRDNGAGYKSGNLTNGLRLALESASPPEFVASFDADFVARPEFLRRTLALMHDEKVAIVQTPQYYFNADPFQHAFGTQGKWPDDTRDYMEARLPCEDALGEAMCCGTSFLARVSAVSQVGGFATEALSDDTLLSIKLKRVGFKTVFLHECLSTGLAVEGVSEYFCQRGKWCLGNLQIAFSPWGELAGKTGFRKAWAALRSFYWGLSQPLHWFAIYLPIAFYFFGSSLIQVTVQTSASYVLPMIVTRFALFWMERGRQLPIITDASLLVSSFAVIKANLHAIRHPKIRGFPVTPKGKFRNGRIVYWRLLLPLGGTLVLLVTALAFSLARVQSLDQVVSYAWIYPLSLCHVLTLAIACRVCVELPKFRPAERFAAHLPAAFHSGSQAAAGTILELSETGCLFSSSERPDNSGTIKIAEVGEWPARVARDVGDGLYGIAFDLDTTRKAELIRSIYCTDRFFTPPQSWPFVAAIWPVFRQMLGLKPRRRPAARSMDLPPPAVGDFEFVAAEGSTSGAARPAVTAAGRLESAKLDG